MLPNKYFAALVINAIFVKVLLGFPKTVVENSANAAWIQVIYNVIIALLFFYALTRLYNRKKNIIQVAELNGGKPLKIIAGIAVTAVLMINLIPIIRLYPETVKIVLLKETNTEIIVIVMAAAAAIAASFGLEAIARIHKIFLPIAAAIFVGFLLLLIPEYKTENIMPILGNGARSIFLKGFNSMSLFSDLIILNLLIPYTENLDTVRRYGRYAIIISGAAAVLVTAAFCLTYSYPSSKDFLVPVYQMSRLVNLSSFFSRFEAFFEFVWSILILLYTALYLYMICYTIQLTLSLRYLNALILPVTIIVFVMSLIPESIMQMMKLSRFLGHISYIPAFALMLIFSRVKSRAKQ
jgi:spore germination protein (amino acid permease)